MQLAVCIPVAGGGDWFIVHEYRDVAAVSTDAAVPGQQPPAIAAFTPHIDGQFGVTIAEYTVEY